jgi:hypothetical protein
MRLTRLALWTIASLLAVSAHAAPVTLGALSSNDDGSTGVITDSLNNREWLRLDQNKTLNTAETLAAIAPGGLYAGFHIATSADIRLFLNAFLSPETAPCALADCHVAVFALASGELLGDNLSPDSAALDLNALLYLNGLPGGVGIVTAIAVVAQDTSVLELKDNYSTTAAIDLLSSTPGSEASFLLYRDVAATAVPEPGTMALAGIALAGFMGAGRRRRRQGLSD